MSFITRFFKRRHCKKVGHRPGFLRNIYGDEINVIGARSIWRCAHCGSEILQKELYRGKDYR
jgi:hypothetical protein